MLFIFFTTHVCASPTTLTRSTRVIFSLFVTVHLLLATKALSFGLSHPFLSNITCPTDHQSIMLMGQCRFVAQHLPCDWGNFDVLVLNQCVALALITVPSCVGRHTQQNLRQLCSEVFFLIWCIASNCLVVSTLYLHPLLTDT